MSVSQYHHKLWVLGLISNNINLQETWATHSRKLSELLPIKYSIIVWTKAQSHDPWIISAWSYSFIPRVLLVKYCANLFPTIIKFHIDCTLFYTSVLRPKGLLLYLKINLHLIQTKDRRYVFQLKNITNNGQMIISKLKSRSNLSGNVILC